STSQASDQQIQRQCSTCAVGRTCPACQSEQERRIQTKPLDSTVSGKPPNSSMVKSSGSGTLLSREVRARVEPVLGADLSNVQVHSDSSANTAARNLGAKAFTHQNHIWLGAQQSPDDVELMAHESTHVVQQSHGVHS